MHWPGLMQAFHTSCPPPLSWLRPKETAPRPLKCGGRFMSDCNVFSALLLRSVLFQSFCWCIRTAQALLMCRHLEQREMGQLHPSSWFFLAPRSLHIFLPVRLCFFAELSLFQSKSGDWWYAHNPSIYPKKAIQTFIFMPTLKEDIFCIVKLRLILLSFLFT